MAIAAPIERYTPAEYLALERQSEFKSEYIDGYIVAMGGGTQNHSRIKTDLARIVGNQLNGGPCEPYDSDLRVYVDPNRYTYPDLTVVCRESQFEDAENDTLVNPTAIFEAISPFTEASDRGEKWGRYRRMPSLQQYVLVSQNKPLVEVFTRHGEVWTFSDARGLEASIHLESIGCTLALGEVYGRVSFEEVPPLGGPPPPPALRATPAPGGHWYLHISPYGVYCPPPLAGDVARCRCRCAPKGQPQGSPGQRPG